MKVYKKRAGLAFLILSTVLLNSCASVSPIVPITPKEDIPQDIPEDVREQIMRLYGPSMEKAEAARELSKMGEKAAPAIPYLISILGDYNQLVWRSSDSGPNFPLQPGEKATDAGIEAMEALVAIGEKSIESLSIAAVSGKDDRAAFALGKIKTEKSVDALLTIATNKDINWRARIFAIKGLGVSGSFKATDILLSFLNDRRAEIAEASAYALGNIKDKKAAGSLLEALNSQYTLIRAAAAFALGQLKERQALEPLIHRLRDRSILVRHNAIIALGAFHNPEAIDALISIISKVAPPGIRYDFDLDEHRSEYLASKALGNIEEPKTIIELTKLLKSENSNVRSYAILGLKYLTSSLLTIDSNDKEILVALEEAFEEVKELLKTEKNRFTGSNAMKVSRDLKHLLRI